MITLIFATKVTFLYSQIDFQGNPYDPFDNINCNSYVASDFINVQGLEDKYEGYLYDQNSTFIHALYFCDREYFTFSESNIAWLKTYLQSNYDGAELLAGNELYTMNCYGYAWHLIEGGGFINLGISMVPVDTPPFYNHLNQYIVGSYIHETSNSTFPNAIKVMYPENTDHAAITTTESNIFISKWSAGGPLVKHSWDEHPYDQCSLNDLQFYAPGKNYSLTKEINNISFLAGTYLFGKKFSLSNVKIGFYIPEYVTNPDWFTIEATEEVIINGPFEVTLGSSFEINVNQ